MKKGFTLIELICVITILGLIALIAIPTINNMVVKSRADAYKEQLDTIIDAARTYMSTSTNSLKLPAQTDGASTCVTVKELQDAGIIDENESLENPCADNKCSDITDPSPIKASKFNGRVDITWNETKNKYVYTYSESTTPCN